MSITDRRGANACLQPVLIDHLVEDPEAVRELARRTGPHHFPERPGGFIWPTWHSQWAENHLLLVDAAAPLFQHEQLIAATAQMCGLAGDTIDVEAEGLYVNLGTPWIAQPVKHTDLPAFRGLDHSEAPGWFFQAMGTSRLFEAERINSVTAVMWFFAGAHGGFSYWPDGVNGEPKTQTQTWNTAIVGDNDFMYHKVERIGPDGTTSPDGMTAASTLDHDGDTWVVVDDGKVIGRYDDNEVRLSVSWRAKVHDGRTASLSPEKAFDVMAAELGADMVATSVDDLFDEPSRLQLMQRWPGFVRDSP